MSYCRWSEGSELYIYEDATGGWTTCVRDNELPNETLIFNDPSPGACADRAESLRARGYNVPQRAIDELRDQGNQPD